MQSRILPFILVLLTLPFEGRAQVSDDFENNSPNGWYSEGDGSFSVSQEIDDPNYSFKIVDNATGDYNYAIAPARYLGDWSAATSNDTLGVDFYVRTSTTLFDFVAPTYEISGPGGRATALPGVFLPADTWVRQSISLNEADWTLEEGEWEALLSSVTLLRVLTEYRTGPEDIFLDNVVLSFNPQRSDFSEGVCSTFEDGTLDGWRFVDNGAIRIDSLDGNPGQGAGVADLTGVTGTALAPAKFWGDWSGLQDSGYLQFDLRIDNTSGGEIDKQYLISVSNETASAYVLPESSELSSALDAWHTFRFYINEDDWTVTEGTWEDLVDNVEEVSLEIEFVVGNERASLDNFCLQPADAVSAAFEPFTDERIRVFPNPGDGPLRITSPEHRILSVTLLDFSGRELVRQPVDALEYTLETTYRGPAVVRITTPAGAVYRRVVLR